jgi:hypothetical protein
MAITGIYRLLQRPNPKDMGIHTCLRAGKKNPFYRWGLTK